MEVSIMADVVLSGKITRISDGRMVTGKNGQIACLDFDICVNRGGKKRVDLMDNSKQYSGDFYRCTLWGEKAVAFHRIMGGQTGRIVQVSGTMLEEAFPKTGDVFIGSDNPMYALISQYGNPSFGITFDQSRNGFWVKGTYAYKTYNVNAEKFTLLDYVPSQQPTGFGGNNGNSGFNGQAPVNNGFNTGAGFGGQAPANNGFNASAGFGGVAPTNNGFGGQPQTQIPNNSGFGQQQAPANNGFGQTQAPVSNGFGTQVPANNGFSQAPVQAPQETGFGVADVPATENPNLAGFGGTEVPATFVPNDSDGVVDTNISAPSEFVPDAENTEKQPF